MSRRFDVLMSFTLTPDTFTAPPFASQKRMNSLSKVLLPLPLRPVMPTMEPRGMSALTPSSMVSPP